MKRFAVLILALLLLPCLGCTKRQPYVTKTSFKLDTVVTITLFNWRDESTIELAMKEIDRLEALLSVDKTGSDLYCLAEQAGQNWVDISQETEEILAMAKEYYCISEGYFDVTTGPLISLWNIHDGTGHYPTQEELTEVRSRICGEKLLVEHGRAYLTDPDMKVNLGAIAKGYIADQVKDLLLSEGVTHGIIDLGRNILLIGEKEEGKDFRIGVQNPFEQAGKPYTVLSVSDKSVVTSGVYERYFEYEGEKYHHILDPFTGYPAKNELASVTILSDRSVQGDALSTTCLLLGVEKGRAIIEKIPSVEAMFITADGESAMTSGFSNWLP